MNEVVFLGFVVSLGVVLVFVVFNTLGFLTGAPYAFTPKKIVKEVFAELKLTSKDTVLDLGAGDGAILVEGLKAGARVIGVELNPVLYLVLKWRFRGNPKAKILWGDFRRVNLKEANVIFLFLLPETVKGFSQKLKTEVRSGNLVLTYLSQIEGKKVWKNIRGVNFYQF